MSNTRIWHPSLWNFIWNFWNLDVNAIMIPIWPLYVIHEITQTTQSSLYWNITHLCDIANSLFTEVSWICLIKVVLDINKGGVTLTNWNLLKCWHPAYSNAFSGRGGAQICRSHHMCYLSRGLRLIILHRDQLQYKGHRSTKLIRGVGTMSMLDM